MADNKITTNTDNNSGRIFGSWTDIIILCIAVTPSALLYYELSKIRKRQDELEARVAEIEKLVFVDMGDKKIPVNALLVGIMNNNNENGKAVDAVKKDNAKLIKRLSAIEKHMKMLTSVVGSTTRGNKVNDLSASRRSNTSSSKFMDSKFLADDDDDEIEEATEEDATDDLINQFNSQVV